MDMGKRIWSGDREVSKQNSHSPREGEVTTSTMPELEKSIYYKKGVWYIASFRMKFIVEKDPPQERIKISTEEWLRNQ